MKKIIFLICINVIFLSANEPFNYDPFTQNDPMLEQKGYTNTTNKSGKKVRPLIVSSVFGDKAFINGRWYKKGDFVRGYKILHVNSKYIKIRYNLKTKKLPVGGNRTKILKIKDFK